ncbi:hypothetical protein [Streptomyces nigrescens]
MDLRLLRRPEPGRSLGVFLRMPDTRINVRLVREWLCHEFRFWLNFRETLSH